MTAANVSRAFLKTVCLPYFVDSLDSIDGLDGSHEFLHAVDIERDGEFSYVVYHAGLHLADIALEACGDSVDDVHEQVVSVDALDDDTDKIERVGMLLKLHRHDGVAAF